METNLLMLKAAKGVEYSLNTFSPKIYRRLKMVLKAMASSLMFGFRSNLFMMGDKFRKHSIFYRKRDTQKKGMGLYGLNPQNLERTRMRYSSETTAPQPILHPI